MKNLAKHLSLFLAFIFVLSVGVFTIAPETEVSAAEIKTYVGDMTISRSGLGWNSGEYENQLMLVKPGSSLNALYFGKVYAVYDSSKGGYVVTEKAGLHCSYSRTVASNGVGLAIAYQPLTNIAPQFARDNWVVWQQIRIGDILTFTNVDVATGTIQTSGTFGNSNFTSSSKVHVTTVRDDAAPKTGYTGKTIVALGDSVTAGGAWTEAVELAINGKVINVATPGDRTDEGLSRFDTLVAANNPDIVFIKYAINDCCQYTITSDTLPNYKDNLRELCQLTLDIGAFPILLTTNDISVNGLNYDRYASFGGLPTYFPQYQQAIREVAEEFDTFCIDLYDGIWSSITTNDYLMDSVHPSGTGYAMEAEFIIDYLLDNEAAIIAKVNEVTGENSGMPAADKNYALSTNGGSYMYPTTTYPGGSGYYATSYYGDNSNQGGAYFSGKLNDGVFPADTYASANNTDWAVYFAGAVTPTVTFKLSSKIYLNNITYLSRNGNSGVNYIAPVLNSVEISTDGTNFTKTTAFTTRTISAGDYNCKLKLTFNQIIGASYIRLTFATPSDRTPLGEVQIWGSTTLPEGAELPFELVDDSDYSLEADFVTTKGLGISATAIKSQFKCDVVVKDASGNEVSDATYIGTGFTIVHYAASGEVANTVTVIIPGDLTGDSDLNATDLLAAEKIVSGTSLGSEILKKAADLTGDDMASTSDILVMEGHCAGTAPIN